MTFRLVVVALAVGIALGLKRHYADAEKDFTAAIESGLKSALIWRAFARKAQENTAGAVEDLKAYRAALPNGYATEEAIALLKELGAN